MKNRKLKTLLLVLAVILSMSAFPLGIYANTGEDGGESVNTEETENTETPSPEVTPNPAATPANTDVEIVPEEAHTETQENAESAEPSPLTPEGNLSLVDDVSGEAAADKQFVTVVSKNGNYFYLIIDRAADGKDTVHFLNQVDEADLAALIDGGEFAPNEPTVITPTPEATPMPTETPEPEPTPEVKDKNKNTPIIVIAILIVLGGIALYYFKVVRARQSIKGGSSLDDFYLDDEDEDEDIEYETFDYDKEDNDE